MYTAKRIFELQSSRFSLVLQLFCFLGINILLYQLLSAFLWLVCLLIMGWAGWSALNKPKINQIEYLCDDDWSIRFDGAVPNIEQGKLLKIVDHHLYIVLYFSNIESKTCVIWWDQLSLNQWKMLKLLSKLA
jgi:hypothetical protein